MSNPEQELCLFIGGPAHGETLPVPFEQTIVHIPNQRPFLGGTTASAIPMEEYRRFFHVAGQGAQRVFYVWCKLSSEEATIQYKAYIRENA